MTVIEKVQLGQHMAIVLTHCVLCRQIESANNKKVFLKTRASLVFLPAEVRIISADILLVHVHPMHLLVTHMKHTI